MNSYIKSDSPHWQYPQLTTPTKMIAEAMRLYGVTEIPGEKSNSIIMGWARELGLLKSYSNDDVPWCGLFMGIVAKRAGKNVVESPLWAKNWAKFGRVQPKQNAVFGDVLVFVRPGGGGHVALYIAESDYNFITLGGNTKNQVCIMPIAKNRLYSVNRPNYIKLPEQCKKYFVTQSGPSSTNEQ